MEDRGSTDDEMSRKMWEEVEGRKADETRVEKTGKTRRKEEKKKKRKPTIEKVRMIERIMEEKEEEEEDLIELRATNEMVPRQFHKYLKVFEKKDSERMPTRKA